MTGRVLSTVTTSSLSPLLPTLSWAVARNVSVPSAPVTQVPTKRLEVVPCPAVSSAPPTRTARDCTPLKSVASAVTVTVPATVFPGPTGGLAVLPSAASNVAVNVTAGGWLSKASGGGADG